MSKEQILERYLNTIFFGNNAYALQAAAEVYFGKSVDQLDTGRGERSSPASSGRRRATTRSAGRSGRGHGSSQVIERLVDVEPVARRSRRRQIAETPGCCPNG